MKKYISKVILFFVVVVLVDYAFDFRIKYLLSHAQGGKTFKTEYIRSKMKEDIIIFGSSRALHHYNPDILTDSTGLSCYNCGQNATGIILTYAYYKIVSKYHIPKYIIYDLSIDYDYKEGNNHRSLRELRPYLDDEDIRLYLKQFSYLEYIKCHSSLYRANGAYSKYVIDQQPTDYIRENGFVPMQKNMVHEPEIKEGPITAPADETKIFYFHELIKLCKANGTKLIFATSPSYKKTYNGNYQPFEELAKEYNIPFFQFYCDTTINLKREYFFDSVHMNKDGADDFSRIFASQLRKYLQIQQQ